MNGQSLIDYIPFGHENAISRQRLCQLTGLPDRSMRDAIAAARREYAICNDQDGNGYYRPRLGNPVDERLAREWVAQETARAKSIFYSMHGARQFVKESEGGHTECPTG